MRRWLKERSVQLFIFFASIFLITAIKPADVFAQTCSGSSYRTWKNYTCNLRLKDPCSSTTYNKTFSCSVGGDGYTGECGYCYKTGETCLYDSTNNRCIIEDVGTGWPCKSTEEGGTSGCKVSTATATPGGGDGCPAGTTCKAACNESEQGYATCSLGYCCGAIVSGCNTTAPTNLSVSQTGSSTWTLTWTRGTHGDSQRVYVGTNSTKVQQNCPLAGDCIVKDEAVGKYTESYLINGLSPGTVYYYKVVTYVSSDCKSGSMLTNLSSCDLTPSALSLNVGQSSDLIANVFSSSYIDRVDFSTITTEPNSYLCVPLTLAQCNRDPASQYCRWTGISCVNSAGDIQVLNTVSLNPTSDSTYIYQTLVTGIRKSSPTSTTTITGNVYTTDGNSIICTRSIHVNVDAVVTQFDPWWQVKDGDVSTNGDLYSAVP